MTRTDIDRQAIERTFANLYGVSPDAVEVSWTSEKTCLLLILSDPDEDTPEFFCRDEDPVILTDGERSQLESAVQ